MFPRLKRISTEMLNEVEVNYYTDNQGLIVDKNKCVGCGICVKVCPKSAMKQAPLNGKIKVTTEDLTPSVPDPVKCSYCGTCVYMCPFSAITLKKGGKEIKIDELDIVTKNVVPKIDYKMVECQNANTPAKVYQDGKLEVDWNKCVSCMSCVGVCPTGAFFGLEKKEQFGDELKPRKVNVNPDKCIACSTCVDACSKNAISLTIEDIKFSGEYKEIFWMPLLYRLKTN